MQILTTNLPRLLELQLCSTFNPDLQWTEQVERCFIFYFVYFFKLATGVIIIFIFKLSPLLGQEETDKLDNKLRSLNVTGNENPPSMMITIISTARCKTALVKLLTHLFPAADLDDLHLSYLQFFPNYQHRDEARFEASLSVDVPCEAVSIYSAFVPTRHFNVNYTTSSLSGC